MQSNCSMITHEDLMVRFSLDVNTLSICLPIKRRLLDSSSPANDADNFPVSVSEVSSQPTNLPSRDEVHFPDRTSTSVCTRATFW
mmetsp:Transcript_14031/g.23339  ORF Transcript_14031/g.23339 Transcript_14031/m.23339 type:complete len:85 (-) Transcript_14031:91-345(-)